MSVRKSVLRAVFGFSAAVALIIVVTSIQRERRLQPLLAGAFHESSARLRGGDSDPVDPAIAKEKRKIKSLRGCFEKRDISALVAALDDESPSVKAYAMRRLAFLEAPEAEAHLKNLLPQTQAQYMSFDLTSVDVKLAIGRIQARSYKGQQKLNCLANSVGLSWADVVCLSAKVNKPGRSAFIMGSQGDKIVNATVQMLLSMGKQGDDISHWTNQLTLEPSQQKLLTFCSLNDAEEAKALLDYASNGGVITSDKQILITERIIDLGRAAVPALVGKLEEINAAPATFWHRQKYEIVFGCAATQSDKALLPVLAKLESSSNSKIANIAKAVRRTVEGRAESWHQAEL